MPKVSVPRAWVGETVAILATGPSLTAEDCLFLRGRARVIAINDAHRLAPWADVLYSSDRAWWPHYNGVPAFGGHRYGVGSKPGKANPFHGHPEIAVLEHTGLDGLELAPTGLRTAANSGYAAINLAVHFGVARILLLGYNMGYPDGRAHFFGNHPPTLMQREGLYPGFRRSFESLVAPLQALGVDVLNCTPNTSLDTFRHADLREVLVDQAVTA